MPTIKILAVILPLVITLLYVAFLEKFFKSCLNPGVIRCCEYDAQLFLEKLGQ